jgi:hypothetical protein
MQGGSHHPITRDPVRPDAARRHALRSEAPSSLRTGVVCGISYGSNGAEVTVRLSVEQWLVTTVSSDCCIRWGLAAGRCVLIDASTAPFRIIPSQAGRT